jgi:hypothetical protein
MIQIGGLTEKEAELLKAAFTFAVDNGFADDLPIEDNESFESLQYTIENIGG